MVACLSASKSVQSNATTMELRAPTTKGTQRERMSSTLIFWVGEQAIDLFGRVLGVQTAGGGESPADGADRERGAAQHGLYGKSLT